MKRHIALALLRLLLAVAVVFVLPLSHAHWGEAYPGDGQKAFGFIIIFGMIGLGAAALFVGLGSLGQFLLKKRPVRLTVFADLGLFLVFVTALAYAGVTAKYQDTKPENDAPTTRRSDSSPAPEARQKVAHGVSRGYKQVTNQPRQGRQKLRLSVIRSFAPAGACPLCCVLPTAHAVGYFLTPLRSYVENTL